MQAVRRLLLRAGIMLAGAVLGATLGLLPAVLVAYLAPLWTYIAMGYGALIGGIFGLYAGIVFQERWSIGRPTT